MKNPNELDLAIMKVKRKVKREKRSDNAVIAEKDAQIGILLSKLAEMQEKLNENDADGI